MEKWTQSDYYGFANLFARVAMKEDGGGAPRATRPPSSRRPTATSCIRGSACRCRRARSTASRCQPRARGSPRLRRAQWLTRPTNTLFARTIVNRVWANFFGRGLVHPVDDLRFTNPASNEALFDAVTRRFRRRAASTSSALMRTIMLSAAYQRAAETDAGNANDDRFYSRYLMRRLPAEVILDAFSQVTGVPEDFGGYPRARARCSCPTRASTRISSTSSDVPSA